MKALTIAILGLTLVGCASHEATSFTPANQAADLRDDDADGVINARDLCEKTPYIAEINNDGCPQNIEKTVTGKIHILFDVDSTNITASYQNNLDDMAVFLKEYTDTKLEIQGYASKTGKSNHNLELSEQRAQNVRKALIFRGIAPNRLTIVAHGDNLKADNQYDLMDHAANRRVSGTVVGQYRDVEQEWTIFTTKDK